MNTLPLVSVIMPIRNEANFIRQSLGAILAQNYPHDKIEVLISDGMSDDNTREQVQEMALSSDIPISIVDNPAGIAPTGLNLALKLSKGEIIVRVDGHTIIEFDYVSECVAALKRTDACNVGGRMNAVSDNKIGKVVALATSSPFGIGNARFHYSEREEFVDTVYLGAWHKHVFDKYGLFNEQLVRNQDDEFNYRLRANNCKILLCPKIRSRYYNRSSLKTLWRQYFQYGFWKVRVLQLHPRQMSVRQFVPFIFVASIVLLTLFSIVSVIGRWGLATVIGSYLAANLLASAVISIKTQATLFPLLSLSFIILHISYGLGFLIGLISFGKEWKKRSGQTNRIHRTN